MKILKTYVLELNEEETEALRIALNIDNACSAVKCQLQPVIYDTLNRIKNPDRRKRILEEFKNIPVGAYFKIQLKPYE